MSHGNTPNFPYLPHTDEDRRQMLNAIGVASFEDLVKHIPEAVRKERIDIPSGLSEQELRQKVASLAARNKPVTAQASFLGGGSYNRFVPAAVSAIVSRSEFATAYTPYQPEVSQGTLQTIYEFQTAVCLLTGMDVANASMYDGPTAAAEAALMAARLTGRDRIVASAAVNPEYRMVTRTYADSCGLTLAEAAAPDGTTDPAALELGPETAAIMVQHPNFFGGLEKLAALAEAAHGAGALLIVVTEPISLGLLESPGAQGADIVVGDAQPCGNFLSFGGPSAGYMATRQGFVRQLPGRLAGMTVDNRGQQAFTLTLQTREQHIRRAKATSNICTNQALNALTMLVYLTLMGPQGLKEVAEVSVLRAHYLEEKLTSIKGVDRRFAAPFFSEFVLETEAPAGGLLQDLQEKGILGGLELKRFYPDMENCLLVSVTEMNPVSDLDRYAEALSAAASRKSDGSLLAAPQHAKA